VLTQKGIGKHIGSGGKHIWKRRRRKGFSGLEIIVFNIMLNAELLCGIPYAKFARLMVVIILVSVITMITLTLKK